MRNLVGKTIDLELVGIEPDEPCLMGAFEKQAEQEGWSKDEVKTVLSEAQSRDYDHLLRVLVTHCKPEDQNSSQ